MSVVDFPQSRLGDRLEAVRDAEDARGLDRALEWARVDGVEVFPARVDDALEWVRDGLVTDTKTIIGLLWWDRFGRSR